MKRTAILLLLGLLSLPAGAEDPARKVLDCVRANVPPQLSIERIELTVHDRGGGSRQLTGRLFVRKEASGLLAGTLRVDGPAEFKGAAYLVRETEDYLRDGMFVYLPGVKRVRRVTGTFADASLMGTNFSYFDFKQLQNAFGDLSGTLEGSEPVNGRPAHVMSFQVLPGAETRYTGVRVWFDQQACVGVRAEFRENKRVVKELNSLPGSLKQAGGTWYVSEIEMRDLPAGTRTVLRMGGLDPKTPPPARYFDPNSFYLGP
jgi:hypothetical protein